MAATFLRIEPIDGRGGGGSNVAPGGHSSTRAMAARVSASLMTTACVLQSLVAKGKLHQDWVTALSTPLPVGVEVPSSSPSASAPGARGDPLAQPIDGSTMESLWSRPPRAGGDDVALPTPQSRRLQRSAHFASRRDPFALALDSRGVMASTGSRGLRSAVVSVETNERVLATPPPRAERTLVNAEPLPQLQLHPRTPPDAPPPLRSTPSPANTHAVGSASSWDSKLLDPPRSSEAASNMVVGVPVANWNVAQRTGREPTRSSTPPQRHSRPRDPPFAEL